MSAIRPSGRVVVTGLGAVTPLGTGVDTFWRRLIAGETGVAPITLLDPSDYSTRIAAEVKDFDAAEWVDKKDARRMDRFLPFAVAAARMAVEQASLPADQETRDDIGAVIGSGIGGLTLLGEQYETLLNSGPSRVSPFLVPYMIPDMAAGLVTMEHSFRGPSLCTVSACSTGAHAIGEALETIRRGDAHAMLAGGCEAPINKIGLGGFCAARAMSTRNDDPSHASRPFDKERDGFVMGEGAAMLMLEDLDFAKARGANILAEIIGYGQASDAHHITAPHPDGVGAVYAMRRALDNAGIQPADVDYVNAHGTSTPLNDKTETAGIKKVFGDKAHDLAVSSTKSMVGHLLGAAGSLEALICVKAISESIAPPTANLEFPDPDCDLDYVPNTKREMDIDIALSYSAGFGGKNVALVLRKYGG